MAIALANLNNKTLGQITGSEKIPCSGSGDPSLTPDLLASYMRKVTVVAVEYGSEDDQASVVQAAINAATPGGCLWFGQGVVKIETALSLQKKIHLIGNGTIFRTTSNIPILTMSTTSANESVISGISFEGNETGNAQIGLAITTMSGFKILNCNFKGCAVAGLQIGSVSSSQPYPHNEITNCWAYDCGIGFKNVASAAYMTFTGCGAYGNTTGWQMANGNWSMVGCTGTDNTTGFLTATGTNNGHSSVVGCLFNHNNSNVTVTNIDDNEGSNPLSLMFVGCQMFTGGITVSSDLIFFNACQISTTGITINGDRVVFTGCRIHGTPTVSGTGTDTVWTDCYSDDGSEFTGGA